MLRIRFLYVNIMQFVHQLQWLQSVHRANNITVNDQFILDMIQYWDLCYIRIIKKFISNIQRKCKNFNFRLLTFFIVINFQFHLFFTPPVWRYRNKPLLRSLQHHPHHTMNILIWTIPINSEIGDSRQCVVSQFILTQTSISHNAHTLLHLTNSTRTYTHQYSTPHLYYITKYREKQTIYNKLNNKNNASHTSTNGQPQACQL